MSMLTASALAALFPLLFGFIWYNPKILGKAWMDSAGLTEEKMKGANMILIFGLTYLFSFFVAISLNVLTIHQLALSSLIQGHETDPVYTKWKADSMALVGEGFRTFKHGALHGILSSIFLILPVIAINAMFERRGFKYILINWGFWAVCFVVMGGIVCQFVTHAL